MNVADERALDRLKKTRGARARSRASGGIFRARSEGMITGQAVSGEVRPRVIENSDPEFALLTLVGVLIVVVGFAFRVNPLLVVTVAGIATGIAGGLSPLAVVAAFGKAFITSRYVAIVWLVLPVIGLLEHAGLKERARALVAGLRGASTSRILLAYFAVRQVTAALGLTSLGGHPQMVRPLIAPMAEGAAENRYGALPDKVRHRIRAHAAAVDNVALFFGEDIFIAIGSILLIKGFLDQNGIHVEPTDLAVWAIPTAICAFVIHCTRLFLLDRSLAAELERGKEQE
jgi:uncharacterized membrane protein